MNAPRNPFVWLLSLTLVVALAFGWELGSASAVDPPAAPEVGAEGVAILDGETGALVYGKNPHKRFAMASLTKTMTAVVALETTDIKRRVVIDVTWDELPDSSIMGLSLMEELTIEDLLYGLMLPSGNDAARAIARSISGDEYRFAKLMNRKAEEIGLKDTRFANPHGMDQDGHYSTAFDQAKLGMYAMRNPVFARIVATDRITITGHGIYPLNNINRVLDRYPGCDGIKTGYTENAYTAVVTSAQREGRRVYVAVLRSWDYAGDAIRMMDYYFENASLLVPRPQAAREDSIACLMEVRHHGGACSATPEVLAFAGEPLAIPPVRRGGADFGRRHRARSGGKRVTESPRS